MVKVKQYLLIILSIIFVIALLLGKPVYATTCELSINDKGNENGFITKDGQLYYVVTISSKTYDGTLSSIKFVLKYDDVYLEMLDLKKGEILDLGEKGIYEGKSHIMCYQNKIWRGGEGVYNFNDKTATYNGGEKKNYTLIDEDEIDLVKVCFKVKDNVKKERSVYIDTQFIDTKITGAQMKADTRYVTNGVDIPEWMLEKENKEEQIPPAGGNDSQGDEQDTTTGGDNSQGNGQKPTIGGDVSQGDGQKPTTGENGSQDDGKNQNDNDIGSGDKKEDIIKIPAKEEGSKKEDVKAPSILPKTGAGKVAIAIVMIVSVLGAIQYIKLRKMRDIK